MADTDRTGSHSVRMTSDEILGRGFPSKVRGISETEVRSFLRRVGEEVDRLGEREDELKAKVAELKTALTEKPKATKSELLESLGEQTTRVLSSAEEAAEQMVTDARAEAEATLAAANSESEQMVIDARAQAEQTIADAQSRVRALQESSQRDVDTVVNEARIKGREIFQESVVVREQILKDLLRRRDLLLEQIDELRKGREELLESYKVVKGSFQKATDALHSVEEKASNELMPNAIDVDELLKTPVELPGVLDASQPIPSGFYDQQQAEMAASQDNAAQVVPEDAAEAITTTTDDAAVVTGKRKVLKKYMKDALGVGPEDGVANMSDLSTQDTGEVEVVETPSTAIGNVTAVPKKKDVGALFQSLKEKNDDDDDTETIVDLVKEDEVVLEEKVEAPSKKASKKKTSPKKDPIALRDDALSDVTSTILRKAKRQLQDEQNELLEALRTIKAKKRIAAENILPDEQTQLKTWEEAIRVDLEMVFAQGAKTVSNVKQTYEADAMKSAVSWIITPLRETLQMAIDEGEQADATTRVGARYREWRNSDLKNALYDALCSAFNNGVISAAKKDATITWNVEKAGQCPDCDDNGLEPTPVGEAFPTGQVAPPAHSGCRCVLTVA